MTSLTPEGIAMQEQLMFLTRKVEELSATGATSNEFIMQLKHEVLSLKVADECLRQEPQPGIEQLTAPPIRPQTAALTHVLQEQREE